MNVNLTKNYVVVNINFNLNEVKKADIFKWTS